MKLHITSWLFTKLDDYLPFIIYMVEQSLYMIKNCVFCWYTTDEKRKFYFFQSLNHVDFYFKPQFLVKSGYYIVPSPSTTLVFLNAHQQTTKIYWLHRNYDCNNSRSKVPIKEITKVTLCITDFVKFCPPSNQWILYLIWKSNNISTWLIIMKTKDIQIILFEFPK